MTDLLKIFASAFLAVVADAFTGWLKAQQTTADEQALGAKTVEAATYADAAERADEIGAIAGRSVDRSDVLQRLRDHSF